MTGKWSEPGTPHKGWTCVDVDDLGEPSEICEMCEIQEIRYVHIMEHPDYPGDIRAGCVCAGHMEEDYLAPRVRERRIRNRAERRKKWLSRRWRRSAKGNAYLNVQGYNITIYRRGDAWSGRILNRETGHEIRARRHYPTEDAAKLAAFDGLMAIQERNLRR